MWNKEIYEAMDDEDYLFGKLTNDGGLITFFSKNNIYRVERRAISL